MDKVAIAIASKIYTMSLLELVNKLIRASTKINEQYFMENPPSIVETIQEKTRNYKLQC